jgi:hypothetical protein
VFQGNELAREDCTEGGESIPRAQPKLLNAQTPFNCGLFELDRLVIECFPIPAIDFHAILISFFRNVARFSENELRKAIAVFLPYLQTSPATDLGAVVESNELLALTRRTITAGTTDALQFVAFVRTLAEASDTDAAALTPALQS